MFKVKFNSPVILGFCGLCVVSFLLATVTNQQTNYLFFSVYSSSFLNPLTYVRLIGHVFGHYNFSHLFNNMMFILILGPILEEKYSSQTIALCIMITAFITGLLQMFIFPNSILLGASGVVFMMILLVSFAGVKEKSIPVTFLLVLILYLGQEVYRAISVKDNISQFGHIVGGLTGSFLGIKLNNIKVFNR